MEEEKAIKRTAQPRGGHSNFPEATPSSRSIVRLRTPSRSSRLGVALLMVPECSQGSLDRLYSREGEYL